LLPDPISIGHGVLAQTFLVMTIVIAYAYSKERARRSERGTRPAPRAIATVALIFIGLIYTQLVLGAIVRHTDSALAIPDFPKTGGQWLPVINLERLDWINQWRLEQSLSGAELPPVSLTQAMLHLFHRYGAVAVFGFALALTAGAIASHRELAGALKRNIAVLDILVVCQIALGIFTVWSMELAIIATLHVVTGAALLAMATLLALRVSPVTLTDEPAPLAQPLSSVNETLEV